MANKKITSVVISLIALLVGLPLIAQQADESFRIKLESTLYRFKNYRFSTISVWELSSIKDLTKAIQTKNKGQQQGEGDETMSQGTGEEPECVKTADELIKSRYRSGVQKNQSKSRIERDMIGANLQPPEKEVGDCIYNYFRSLKVVDIKRIRKGYIVTTRPTKGEIMPNTIIGLIVSYEDDENIEKNIDRPSPSDIYTYDELKQFDLNPKEFGASNLYDLMVTAFMQNNVKNRTLDAQGIGTMLRFAPKTYGVSRSMIKDENDVYPDDVQSFMRVSEGQPNDISYKNYELTASTDLISFKKYDMNIVEYQTGEFDTVSTITNSRLPKYGVELKYGLDDINIPSFNSERLSLRALWQSMKLGLILPIAGWSEMTESAYGNTRTLTHASWGVTGEADFPFKVVKNSGIFHISGSYLFGDAEVADYKDKNLTYDNWYTEYDQLSEYQKFDYLIRAHMQAHYTFGIAVDEDYQFRIGIGGTIYSAETWTELPDDSKGELVNSLLDVETVAGVSGKVEFMAKNVVTPWGGSLQYFNESLMLNAWLMIPLIDNTLALKLDVRGAWAAFKTELHPWEQSSLFIPQARFIVNF